MPTGRITFQGGVSSPAIQVPVLPGNSVGVRGASISDTGKQVKIQNPNPHPPVYQPYGAHDTQFYAGFVPEIAKANNLNPSNQGHRLLGVQEANYTPMGASHSPSRSQFSEGYTDAIQVFASSNTWQLAGPVDSPGTRAKQPNQKFVSPFSSLPIPVKMPWDI